jgi:hypothetical protein
MSLLARPLLAEGEMVKPLLLLFYSCILHGNPVAIFIWWGDRVPVSLVIKKLNYL